MFVTVKLNGGDYARGKYADMTREINKYFGMPTVVLFVNDDKVTLAFIHRRQHKQQNKNRDVLGKVSLIRNVNCLKPHRAHLDILAEIGLNQCIGWIKQRQLQRNFDSLLAAWLAKLDTEELNKRFYKELFHWFQWAVTEAKFPESEKKSVPIEDHIIRLITRILFIWFIKEKNLVANELFDEVRIKSLLKNYSRNNDDFYRVVLQNLFFATLNTEQNKRDFSEESNDTHRNFNRYRYKDLLKNSKEEELLHLMKQTPFINGGLFDCMDSEESTGTGGYRLDCFSDNKNHRKLLFVPNRLFFDEQQGLFPLLNKYKFTVEESTPIEQEVALDPELLGKAFENLLAAYNPETRGAVRKQTGSYYTPRTIVDYMVGEALVVSLAEKIKPADGDTKFLKERIHYLLDYLDAFDDAEELFQETEKNEIVRAIADIKILDPAAGSGAFPMSVLHKLTLALRRIDPKNITWKKLQISRAQKKASEAFDTNDDKTVRRDKLLEINEIFENYRDSDFGRKLYLIQNCIFGVDIQPIACQIAKLRFFISLTIEQQRDDNKENYGIRPLPNLETRFVVADTLVGLQITGGNQLLSPPIKTLEEQLRQNRERHFNAGNRRQKLDCSKKDKELRQQLAESLEEYYRADGTWREAQRINDEDMRPLIAKLDKHNAQILATKQLTLDGEEQPREIQITDDKIAKLQQEIVVKGKLGTMIVKRNEAVCDNEIWNQAKEAARKKNAMIHIEAQKISEWNPYDQNAKAGWFDAEWMFGVTDGFDIVIGNPPYVQLQMDGGRLGELYKDQDFITFTKTGDIYQLFYEQGLNLLTTTGLLCYITSNKWMRTNYGNKTRKLFAEKNPLILLDLGSDAFETATVDTNILLINNNSVGTSQLKAKTLGKEDKLTELTDKDFYPMNGLDETPWAIRSPQEQSIKEKIANIGTPLKEWDVRINYGIKTGFNEAFIIDQHKRDELVAADPKSADIIKPILRGRDIQRYGCEWAGKWIINSHNGDRHNTRINIDDYPAIKKHLDQYYPQLEKRYDKGITPYNLRNCAYISEFEKEKIIYPQISNKIDATYLDKSPTTYYINDKAYCITGEWLKYLTAFLNSKLFDRLINTASALGGKGEQWLGGVKVPKLSPIQQQPFILLADKILVAKAQDSNADTSKLETKIDQLVYQLYDLTAEEIKIVEES